MQILEFSEDTVTVQVNEATPEDNNLKLVFISEQLREMNFEGIFDYSISYNALVIYYSPDLVEVSDIKETLEQIEASYSPKAIGTKRVVEIPVCYDCEFGLDLHRFELDKEEIVALHTEKEYLIYMIGFLPGFPFLNGVDEKLIMERLSTPRTAIPKGSVGIAGSQTGIYPSVSPGGWNIIGRTPVSLTILDNNLSLPFETGDYIKFVSVDRHEFDDIASLVEQKTYKFVVHERSI